jgi:hypothetical protein
MALNDIIVPKENSEGEFDETVLTAGDLKLGTTSGLPIKTGSGGVLEAGAFGSSAGQFAEGNHSHSDATQSVAGFFSSTDKTKLDGIAAGAEVNVNADWNASSGDAQILNKPTLGTAAAAATTDFAAASHTHAASAITSGTLDVARLPVGTGSTQVAAGNHTHVVADVTGAAASGSITSSGLTQATARLLGRTTASTGAVEEIQIGSGLSLSAGELSATGGDTVSIEASAADILSVASGAISADDAGADRIVFWDDSASKLAYLEAGSGLSLSGTTLTATATGTIGGGTGSTDNSILRSDGTGGSTLQDSALVIDDATTSTQANVALRNNHSETNSSLVLTPKGTGALIAGPKPDGTSTGGNARGAGAVDLQIARTSPTQVASGVNSALLGGERSVASGANSVVIGAFGSTASGARSGCFAANASSSTNDHAVVLGGYNSEATAIASIAIGGRAKADRQCILAHGGDGFSSVSGSAQKITAVLFGKTTTNSAVELLTSYTNVRLTIPSGKVMAMLVNITGVKSDGSAVAHYVRQYAIKNVGGTTSEVYAPVTIGTDTAASTSILLEPNDTNDAVKISCTGITSEIWRWVASVDAVEVIYGS